MGYTHATFITALATECAISASDVDFLSMVPTFIDDSEQRIYRELDLVAASVTVTGAVTANNRSFTLPTGSGHFLVVDAVNVIDGSSVRHPATPATRDVIDFLWPSDTSPSAATVPSMFARVDDTAILFGPAPGSAFTAEVIGTIRPAALSVSNTTTFLSNYLPDLFLAGAMVSAAGWMRNFGAQSDDPKMAVSWESQFQSRLQSARREELRKSFISEMSAPPASSKDA